LIEGNTIGKIKTKNYNLKILSKSIICGNALSYSKILYYKKYIKLFKNNKINVPY